ncbi:Phosphoglycerol transferase MdoB [Streptomyces sp. yr375]|nr:Phosphoglycerol transferase MdoB [Streptomyces sp. yr375]
MTGTATPETGAPEEETASQAVTPERTTPKAAAPEAEAPETVKPEAQTPETEASKPEAAEAEAPEAKAPETTASEAETAETEDTETAALEPKAPKAAASPPEDTETAASKTAATETTGPETTASEPKVTETTASKAAATETASPEAAAPESKDTETTAPKAADAEAEAPATDRDGEGDRDTDADRDDRDAADGEGDRDAADREGDRVHPPGIMARVAYWRAWRGRHPRGAQVVSWGVTVLCVVLVLGALVLPNRLFSVHVSRFLRLPGEAIIGAAVLLALPRRPRVALAAVAGAALGALTVLNLLDMGFVEYLGRDFNLVLDWGLLDDAQSYVADSMGGTVAIAAAIGLVLLVVGVMVLMALATVRLSGLLARDTRQATRGTLIAGTAWITCSVLGLQYAGAPLASDQVAHTLTSEARRVRDTLKDEAAFGKVARSDTFGATPADQLVPDLRGKDMIFTFIESYGRSAIEDPVMAPGVDKTLDVSTQALAKAGFHAKSGWLTSATYGGSSWLGHSTTLSGLWVDNQQRYRTVMASDHLSLTKAFKKTGAWDTIGVMPGVQKGWPEAKFYGLDKVYNAFQMGYQGPKFSWSTMPDQYALEAFQRLEHGRAGRDKPLMSEIILTSSHQPWAPIPKMVGWDQLGNGSIFDGIQKAGKKASDVIADSAKSKEEYGKSIQYSVTALTQWLERYGSDDTVLVFLGDHQPIARVSGNNASRDVPISVVAKDPKVLDKIAAWNWTDGLKPAHNAPVWKMDSFRDKFLTAYGSTPHPSNG